jgi:DNA-nicking Smr family endonuclease
MSRRDGRRLRDDEHQLWEVVSKGYKPLRKRPAVPAAAEQPLAEKPRNKTVSAVIDATPPAPARKTPPPLSVLGRREKAKVARGKVEIGAKLDLHGHTQAEAHRELIAFLHKCVARDKRMVLVITGKSGVLRQQVPHWLSLPDVRELIVGFEPAAIRHGGDGALYVRLRRLR